MNYDNYIYEYKESLKSDISDNIYPNINQHKHSCICKCCKSDNINYINGTLICNNCYTETCISIGNTADIFDHERCTTSNPYMSEDSYASKIITQDKTKNATLIKLNKWISLPPKERSLKIVFDKIEHLCNICGFTPNIIEYADYLFTKITNTEHIKLPRSFNRDGVIVGCIYYSCMFHKYTRSPQELSKLCDVNISDVTYGINLLNNVIGVNNLTNKTINNNDFIDRYCNKLNINNENIAKIKIIIKYVDKHQLLLNNTPQSLVCSCILFVSNIFDIGINKTDLANTCDISIPSITKCYNNLIKHTEELIKIIT